MKTLLNFVLMGATVILLALPTQAAENPGADAERIDKLSSYCERAQKAHDYEILTGRIKAENLEPCVLERKAIADFEKKHVLTYREWIFINNEGRDNILNGCRKRTAGDYSLCNDYADCMVTEFLKLQNRGILKGAFSASQSSQEFVTKGVEISPSCESKTGLAASEERYRQTREAEKKEAMERALEMEFHRAKRALRKCLDQTLGRSKRAREMI
ncbi:MAG: hypothetical protein MN733_43390 [Nitrososphaera sp.]|nr:hypothetical protein [Nitrososphaera sp.]